MIVFVTNYDEATQSNLNVLQKSLKNEDIKLLATDAIRENLITHLKENPELPTFVMTHGNSESFISNDKSVAFSIGDLDLFKKRSVYIYACMTVNTLGRTSNEFDSIYWGYTGLLTAAYDNPKSKILFEKIFGFIFQTFANHRSKSEILEFIHQLKKNADLALFDLDEIHKNDETFDSYEGYYCLNQIWSNLRVYYKKGEDRITHPEAPTYDIFEKLY
jgi:hypothetical protein